MQARWGRRWGASAAVDMARVVSVSGC